MPTLSEMNEHANDAEHQAFQRAYDALLDIAKDPITCRHFWDVGFAAGQAVALDSLIGAEVSVDVGTGPNGEELRYFGEVVGVGDDGTTILVGGCEPNFTPPDVRDLVEALREGRRAIGEHSAPHDCYATGPLTGDEFIDLVQCPACCFIAKHDAALAKFGEKS